MPLIAGVVALVVLAIMIIFGGVLSAVFTSNEGGLCSAAPPESRTHVIDFGVGVRRSTAPGRAFRRPIGQAG